MLQHSHIVSHRMVAPWGWGPLGGMGTACSSLQLPCACHGVTDYLKLEGTHEDHGVQLLGN